LFCFFLSPAFSVLSALSAPSPLLHPPHLDRRAPYERIRLESFSSFFFQFPFPFLPSSLSRFQQDRHSDIRCDSFSFLERFLKVKNFGLSLFIYRAIEGLLLGAVGRASLSFSLSCFLLDAFVFFSFLSFFLSFLLAEFRKQLTPYRPLRLPSPTHCLLCCFTRAVLGIY